MKTINKLLTIATIFLILNSCKKQENNFNSSGSMLDIIMNYYKVMNTKVDGAFMFQSNICNNDPNLKNTVIMSGLFYDKNMEKISGNTPVSIGKYSMLINQYGTYKYTSTVPQDGLYGTKVTFSITPHNNNLKETESLSVNGKNNSKQVLRAAVTDPSNQLPVTSTLYIPAAINVSNVKPQQSVSLIYGQPFKITWNADADNANGVVVIANFLPGRYINWSLYRAGYKTMQRSAENVPDNGSTSIPWSFFSKFPAGAHITLWVGRGNFTIASNGTYNYKVGGYSATAIWDIIIPSVQ